MRSPIIIAITPITAGRFRAITDGKEICISREPFFKGARALLASGADADAVAIMRHAGSATDCVRATLKAAARLTVVEDGRNGPRVARWKAPQSVMDGARIAKKRPALSE